MFRLPMSSGVDVGHIIRKTRGWARWHDHWRNHTMRGTNIIAIAALCTVAKVAEVAAGTGGSQLKTNENRGFGRPFRSRAVDQDIARKEQQCSATAAAAVSLGGGGSVGDGGAGGSRRFDKQVTRGDDLQLG